MIKRRRLEFATDESSREETSRMKKDRKRRARTECEDEWGTLDSEDSGRGDSRRKSSEITKNQSGRHFKKLLTLEKFDGTTPLSIFLNQLDTCAQYNVWNEEDKASHLRVNLKGNAAYIIDDENLKGASYNKLLKRLKYRFGTEGQSLLYRSQLRTRRRGKDQTLQTLYHDKNRMAGLAYPGKSSIHRELAAIDAFIDALNDSNLRMRVQDKEPKNLNHIALLAEANTEMRQNAKTTRSKEYKARVVQNVAQASGGTPNASVDSINDRCDKVCEMLETIFKRNNTDGPTVGAAAVSTAANAMTTPPARANVTCFKCHHLGHYATAFPEQASSANKMDGRGPRCYSCQGYGYMAQSCPKADKKKGDNTPAENVRGIGVRGPDVRQMKDHPVYLKAYLGKREVDFLVDTGCEHSVTPRRLIGDAILEPADCRLFAANGMVINVVGEVSVNIRIGDLILPTRFVLSDNITEPMLGVDWLR